MQDGKSCKCPFMKFVYRELTELSFLLVTPVNQFRHITLATVSSRIKRSKFSLMKVKTLMGH